jgi:hypothetical protein
MIKSLTYPYPTYEPNKVVAGCVAAVVSISLIAWFIQSCQARFRPPRLSFLLLLSHLTIFCELMVRATVSASEQNSKNVFTATSSLFLIGQRMIIVGNFAFVIITHHEKSRLSRGILLSAMGFVVTSGLLMMPANILSFKSDQMDTSFLFRQLSASVLLVITLLFYPVWYWSKTIKIMNIQALILIIVSSVLCVILALFNLIQSFPDYYHKINSHEGWFYALQMTPIILAHFTWSILHPKRSLVLSRPVSLETNNIILVNE